MEETMNNNEMPFQTTPLFSFDSPKNQSSYIKVIGVGGGGGNAVNHMFREGITGVDFIVCNTDMKALGASPVPNKIPLGTLGLGAGGKPEKAQKAAVDKEAVIKEALSHNTQMLFITAGMGGGTGTGAAPVIAKFAKEIVLENEENEQILVVAIVTRPFTFEGRERMEQAEAGIAELRKHVDSIIVIDNDKLFDYGDLTMSQAYALADDVLLTAAKGIAEVISKEGYVSRDFQDIKSVMEHSDKALMGIGRGRGENRAKDAINAAATSVLLDDSDITGAKKVLLYFTSSHEHEMRIREQMEITDYVCQATGGYADVKYGAGYDDELGDELRVTLIATGFNKDEKKPGVDTAETQTATDAAANKPADTNTTAPKPDEPYIKPAEPTKPVDEKPQPPAPAPANDGKVVYNLEDDNVAKTTTHKNETAAPVPEDEMLSGIKIVNKAPEPAPAPAPAPVATTPVASTPVAPAPVAPTPLPVAPAPAPAPAPVDVAPVAPAPAPVPPAPAPVDNNRRTVANLVDGAFKNDLNMVSAAERIRILHDILRNDPNGAEKIMNMTTQQIASGEVIDTSVPHSSKREASAYTVQPDGRMTKVPTLYEKLD